MRLFCATTNPGKLREFKKALEDSFELETLPGLKPSDINVVAEMDTARDAWSIASGNYASRFAAAVCGAAHLAAGRLKTKLARRAAPQLNVPADQIEFVAGKVRARGNPDNAVAFARLAATRM